MQLRQSDQTIQSAMHLFVQEHPEWRSLSAPDAMFSGNLDQVNLGLSIQLSMTD